MKNCTLRKLVGKICFYRSLFFILLKERIIVEKYCEVKGDGAHLSSFVYDGSCKVCMLIVLQVGICACLVRFCKYKYSWAIEMNKRNKQVRQIIINGVGSKMESLIKPPAEMDF